MRKTCRLLLCQILAGTQVLSGCIHTLSHARANVQVDAESDLNKLQHQSVGPVAIDSLVYTPAKLPLADFFRRLAAGDFAKAIQQIDLHYVPARSDNAALQNLLDNGFVPVYVRLTNHNTASVLVDASTLSLMSDGKSFKAIAPANLPDELTSFNVAAVGANVANTVIAVAVLVAIVVVMSALHTSSSGLVMDPGDESSIYNRVTKTTTIGYQNYLFPTGAVAPGATVRGLVFFRVPDDVAKDKLRLRFEGS